MVADISSTSVIRKKPIPGGFTLVSIDTPATADTGDTIAISLENIGIAKVLGINGCVHTTANSIMVTEAPTTAVSTGTLTITVGGSSVTDKIRSYLLWGASTSAGV